MSRSIVWILGIIVITANPSKATSTTTKNMTYATSIIASGPSSTSLTSKITSSDQPDKSTSGEATSSTSESSTTVSPANVTSTIPFTGTQTTVFTGSTSTVSIDVTTSEQISSTETNTNQIVESSSTAETSDTPGEQLSSTDTKENQTSEPSSIVATGTTPSDQLSSTETSENQTSESSSTVASNVTTSEQLSSTETSETHTSESSSTVASNVTTSEQLSSTETSENQTSESLSTVASNVTTSEQLSSTETNQTHTSESSSSVASNVTTSEQLSSTETSENQTSEFSSTVASNVTTSEQLSSTETSENQTSESSSTVAPNVTTSEQLSSTETRENQTSESSSTVASNGTTSEQLSSTETNQTQTSEISPTVANGFQTGPSASLGMYNATISSVTPNNTGGVLKPTTNNSYLTKSSNLSMTTDNTILASSTTTDINYSTKTQVLSVSQSIASTVPFQTSTIALPIKDINISVSIQSSPFIVGQNSGVMSCSFQGNSTSNNQTITWSKNGVTLYDSAVVTINTSCNRELHCESNLTLHEVNFLSKGEYKCDVQITAPGVNYHVHAATNVTVKQKPVLVIEPICSSVKEGSNVSFHCKVANIKDAYLKNDTVIKMCFGNKTLRGCYLNSTYDSTCNFVVNSNMTIKCGLSNCSNNSITSTITAVSKADKLCEPDNQWPSTQQGQEARIPCPEGYSGEVTRKCLSNGKWDTTDTSESCTQNKLKEIEIVLQNAKILTADNVESSLSTISSILVVNNSTSSSNEKKLADNDIKQSVDLISTISKKNVTFTDQEAANKTTQIFMGIVSDILGPGNNNVASRDTNADKKEKEKEVTSTILASVNSFAKSVTSALKVNQKVTVKKKNMLLSIEKIDKNTDIKFPKETEDSSQQTTHFVLPQAAFKNMTGTEVAFTAVKYKDIGSEFISKNNTEVGSSVLSLTVNGLDSQYLHENITLLFQRKNVTGNSTECVFLWGNNSDTHSVWNTSGCSLENSTDSQVKCSCNHLTNFAILMSYTEEIPKEDIKRLKIISVFGCSLSIIGAFVTIVLYIYFWRYIKSRRSTLVINLCSALCIAYLLFLTAVEHSENKTGCIIIAALLHYFFLAMFTTMLCLGIDLAIAVFDVFSSRSRSAIFLLVSWGLPAVIVAITLGGSQLEGYGDETYCWLRHTTLFGFIVPVLCIVLVNLIIVIFVMRRIYTSSFMMKKSLKEKTLSGLKGVCGLLPILGLTWVFGIFSVNQDLIIFQYLFAVFNSLQGLFIFLFYVALNPQMREAVARKIKIYDSKSSISKTSKTTKFVSTSYSEEEQNFEEREDGTAASNMFIIPRCSVQNKLFNKRQ